ncbi:MAG: VWA domain-containing protein [Hyphomicrobium sp.]
MSIIQVKRQVPASAPQREGLSGSGQRLRYRDRVANFAQDTAGDVAVLFGLMAMAMFMLIGAAVDLGRWLNARDHTIAAIDAAVLAGGRALQSPNKSLGVSAEQQAKDMAKRYYDEAVKTRLAVSDTVQFKVTDNGTVVTVEGNAKIKTPFMGLAGIKELPLLKANGVENPQAVLAVGGNAELNLEIAMMLDVSGSMGSGTKLQDMKDAAKDLVDIVVWADQSEYTSKISVVPFSGDVRPPASMLTAISDPAFPSSRSYKKGKKTTTYNKTTCVGERNGTNKYTDLLAGSAAGYVTRTYGSCSTPTSGEVKPMTNDKTALTTKITNLTLGGGTAGHIGTAWAYYMLSPKWATLLPGVALPVAFNTPKTQKIAILMTDGEYNYTYDANGLSTDVTGGNGNGTSSANQAKAICTQMKANNIEVFTVGFDIGSNTTATATLSNCATDASHYYNADNAEELKVAFRDIALKISTLHLKQ